MLRIYCRGQHGQRRGLCASCAALETYALARLAHCPFGDQKTTCAQCPVHCYKPAMRAEIRQVMRYAGPRMVYHHPLMALRHQILAWWGGRRRPAKSAPRV